SAGPAGLPQGRQCHHTAGRGSFRQRQGRMSDTASPWAIYRRLRGLATPYRGVLLVALLGLALEGAAAGAFGLLTKPMVDETFVARNQDYGLLLPLAIIGIFVVRGVAGYATDLYMAKAARGIARD